MSSEKLRFIREVAIRYVGKPRRPPLSMSRPRARRRASPSSRQDDAWEHLVAIYLDARHRPIGDAIVSIGTANSTPAHPREIFQMAVGLGACAVVIAHSHPSADVSPSDADIAATRRLAAAGRLLGIELLDHIVWERGGAFRSIAQIGPELLGREMWTRAARWRRRSSPARPRQQELWRAPPEGAWWARAVVKMTSRRAIPRIFVGLLRISDPQQRSLGIYVQGTSDLWAARRLHRHPPRRRPAPRDIRMF
jgi:hypothetical protein